METTRLAGLGWLRSSAGLRDCVASWASASDEPPSWTGPKQARLGRPTGPFHVARLGLFSSRAELSRAELERAPSRAH